jgi:hypothetical protein
MGSQVRVWHKVGQVPVSPGGTGRLDLPRQYDLECIQYRLSGSVQVTVAGSAVRAEAPCQVINRVELNADGKNVLYSAPGYFGVTCRPERSSNQANAAILTAPTAAAVATYPIDCTGVIDMATPDGIRTKDSNFRTAGLSTWQIIFSFGQPTDIFTGGATAAFVNCVVDVFICEMIELSDGGKVTSPVWVRKVSTQSLTAPSTTVAEYRLNAGNFIKSVFIRTDNSGEPSSSVMNNLKLFAGMDVRVDLSAAMMRARNAHDYGRMFSGAYYNQDFTRMGFSESKLSEMWNVTRAIEPKITLDVNGNSNYGITLVTTEYIAIGK